MSEHLFPGLSVPDAWEFYREHYVPDNSLHEENIIPEVAYAELLTKHRNCEKCGAEMRFERSNNTPNFAGTWVCTAAGKKHTIVIVRSQGLQPNTFDTVTGNRGGCRGCGGRVRWK